MTLTVRQCILNALDELGQEDFSRFKASLREVTTKPGFRKIPWGKLEEASRLDAAKLMVDFYREVYAGEMAAAVLRDINQHDTADSLEQELSSVSPAPARGGGATEVSPAPARGGGATEVSPAPARGGGATEGCHLVDQHFSRIIQGFSSIDCVLDRLLGDGVLTCEHYDTIRANKTKQEKNRSLLNIIRGQGPNGKSQLWEAMVEADPFFTQSLTNE
ncbi:apoptosis-associated speck-like protein containing a CARD isoform X4 [Scyliorhinus torazame]|uniref:apoptosis-associated speck-like protein containing a CARD isoform X2 n=1 Tax=Scyliorhinus torazame TaxID=75743 RepID=UPI003B5A7F3B